MAADSTLGPVPVPVPAVHVTGGGGSGSIRAAARADTDVVVARLTARERLAALLTAMQAGWRNLLGMGVGLLLPVLAIAMSALVYVWEPLPLQTIRNAAFDQFQRWHPRPYVDAPVRIVDIDDESLKRLGQWPWPRTRVAELTARMQDAGAAAIAFDVVFAEPDRTSPKAMLELWRAGDEASKRLALLPDHDDEFAKVLARGRVVLGFAVESEGSAASPTDALAKSEAKARFVTIGEPPQPWLHQFGNSVNSLPALASAAAGNGALTFVPDADGVVRRVPLLLRQGDGLLPSLSAEALRVAQGARNYTTRSQPGSGAGLGQLRVGDIDIATTPQAEVWLHYSKPHAERYIPAWKVLAGQVPRDQLENRILLVGTSAQGLMDLRFSPMTGVMPGVEMHAQFLEQTLTGGGLDRPGWAIALELMVIVVGGVVVGAVALLCGARFSSIAFALLVALWWGTAWQAFLQGGLLFDPLSPALALLLTFVLASIVRHLSSERRQRWVKQAFSRYVSPNLVNFLVDHPDSLELGGKRQQCSFVFTDLAGFTSLMEKMDPGQAVALLNEYLDRMIAIAFAHQGTLDRIVGDAVAIMFSAPVVQEDHQRRALACALDMQRFAAKYVDEVRERGSQFCPTRIGIHTGEVIVGNFGGTNIFDYRALGDPVNTASRLEGANKHLGTLICASQATLDGCPDASSRPIGRLVLKGKSQPLMVYEPLEGAGVQDADYQQAFEALRDQQPEALQAFQRLACQRPDDGLVALHLRRLREGQTGDLIVLDEK